MPALRWLRECNAASLVADAVAGFTLAAYMLPAAIGDASLAGLPAESGLYACIFSGMIFWLFCSSQRTAVTVTSAISLLMGTTLAAISGGDPVRHAALAGGTAILTAFIALAAWFFRAGSLVTFISESVLIGFKLGVAITLISTQLPKLLGIPKAHHGGVLANLGDVLARAGDANPASVIVGVGALGFLILGRMAFKHRPIALWAVVGGIAAAMLLHLEHWGVVMLGSVSAGIPAPRLPHLGMEEINEILPLAMACCLLAAVETSAIGRMASSSSGARFDANQELLALAGANLAAGVFKGFPVSGGVSQSLVNQTSGARTPLSGLIASVLMLAVVVFFSGLLRELPQPVLAAIIISAVMALVKPSVLRHLWKTDRQELLVVASAFGGVLASGLLRGVLIGAAISVVLILRRASRPHVALLGRIPGTRRFSDRQRHPDNELVPGVEVFRVEGGLFYFNAESVRDRVAWAVAQRPVRVVICDLSAAPMVDMVGAEMLLSLEAELQERGIKLVVVEARSTVRDRLRTAGLEARIGRIDRFTTVADAVEANSDAQDPRVG